jgi:hypothetical protein
LVDTVGFVSLSVVGAHAQGPATSGTATTAAALKTPWGEPDLQGIWMEETDTPLQRPARFANQEYFTPEQRAELDEVRSALAGKDQRAERGTELDVGGSYNQLFVPRKHSGVRTSMIVDPPNGRIPPGPRTSWVCCSALIGGLESQQRAGQTEPSSFTTGMEELASIPDTSEAKPCVRLSKRSAASGRALHPSYRPPRPSTVASEVDR